MDDRPMLTAFEDLTRVPQLEHLDQHHGWPPSPWLRSSEQARLETHDKDHANLNTLDHVHA